MPCEQVETPHMSVWWLSLLRRRFHHSMIGFAMLGIALLVAGGMPLLVCDGLMICVF